MPIYEFEAPTADGGTERKELTCSVEDLPKVTKRFEGFGWKRIFSAPNVQVVPTYSEAVNDEMEKATKADRKRAKERVEAAKDIAVAIQEEHGKDIG